MSISLDKPEATYKEPDVDESGIPYFEDKTFLTTEYMNAFADNVRKNRDDIKNLQTEIDHLEKTLTITWILMVIGIIIFMVLL